jgi:hypothetical protein
MHLPGILSEYGYEIEADFQQYYRLDIAELYTGGLSPARAFRLVTMLPAESRFARAAAGPRGEWRINDYLLAAVVDTLAVANWQRGGGKGRRPKPLPRPGAAETGTRYGKPTRSQAEVRDYLAKLKSGELDKH